MTSQPKQSKAIFPKPTKSVLLIVAHPDDETLWAGGTLLANPSWDCFVVCLCRGSDRDRAPKFHQALGALGAVGVIDDLDDGPDQNPLEMALIKNAIRRLVPTKRYDLIITHSPKGEYTRHLRHEEIGRAAIALWNEGELSTDELWLFAYEDGTRSYYPKPIKPGTLYCELPKDTWERKYSIVTRTYGFDPNSWEARTTPKAEAFWTFFEAEEAKKRTSHQMAL